MPKYRTFCKDRTCIGYSPKNNTICKNCVDYNDKYIKCILCKVKGTHKLGDFCADEKACRLRRGVDVNDKPLRCIGCKDLASSSFGTYNIEGFICDYCNTSCKKCFKERQIGNYFCNEHNLKKPVPIEVEHFITQVLEEYNFEKFPPKPYSWME